MRCAPCRCVCVQMMCWHWCPTRGTSWAWKLSIRLQSMNCLNCYVPLLTPVSTCDLSTVPHYLWVSEWVMVVTHSQETCTSRLVQETWSSDMVYCTRYILYKFLAPNTAQLYSIQETCMHVTRMVSSDWSASYRCYVFILLCWCCWQFVV